MRKPYRDSAFTESSVSLLASPSTKTSGAGGPAGSLSSRGRRSRYGGRWTRERGGERTHIRHYKPSKDRQRKKQKAKELTDPILPFVVVFVACFLLASSTLFFPCGFTSYFCPSAALTAPHACAAITNLLSLAYNRVKEHELAPVPVSAHPARPALGLLLPLPVHTAIHGAPLSPLGELFRVDQLLWIHQRTGGWM